MKFAVCLGLLFSSLVSLASVQFPAGYTKVAEDRMEDYKKAVETALNQNPTVITGCDAVWVYNAKEYVEDILVQKQSNQPLLIYNTYFNIDNEIQHRLIFTTDASLKNIVRVEAEIYKMGEINQGDLSNPVIVQDYVLQGRWNCQKL